MKELPLKELNLTNEDVGDSIAAIAQIRTLETLVLTGTNITDRDISKLTCLKNLKHLVLSRTHISGSGLDALRSLPDLQVLDVHDCKSFKVKNCKYIADLKQLKRLWINDTNIGDEGMSYLAKSPIEHLMASNIGVTEKGAKYIAEMPHLIELKIGWNNIGDEGVKRLCQMPNLHTLHLAHTDITDSSLETLLGDHWLKNCYIKKNDKLSGTEILKLKSLRPDLSFGGSTQMLSKGAKI